MKLLHLADLHGNRERADDLLKSLAVAKARGLAEGIDVFILAGDILDAAMWNTEGSRFPEIVEAIRSLADVAPVVMIYGTPTHDVAGSLEIFRTLSSRYGITILEPGKTYFLGSEKTVYSGPFDSVNYPQAIFFGVPEPGKRWLAQRVSSKDEGDTAVREALRGLFMGLGATRRQYPNLPCVLVYHGQVAGARLQNGDLLEAGSGLRPSVDDLAAVGADYIAMGDIHEPQRVAGGSLNLPAYYPGSAYPVDFGETHDAGANLVEIAHEIRENLPLDIGWMGSESDFLVNVTRISFGHPVNQTIKARLLPALLGEPDLDVDLKATVKPGNRVKLEVTCTKEEQHEVNAEALLAKLRALGAVEGSIVKPNVLPTETVRVAEIATKATTEEKVEIWFKQSGKEFADPLREKVRLVESEVRAGGQVGNGGHIVLNRLKLRGAIGLWKKSRMEEIDFNLDEIEPGLLALIGHNGAGKTTIFENMHPWPGLLTRDGTLKDHFRGRDAFRDLYWTDERTGTKYRAFITINAATASGSTEYWLYEDTGADFEPVVGITGRKDDYVAAIDRLFGSQELFLRSAFVTQRQPKNLKDLADATQGERKTLFTALCGLEFWEAFKVQAKAKGDEVATQVGLREAEIGALLTKLGDRGEIQAEVEHYLASAEKLAQEVTDLKTQGQNQRAVVDALSIRAQASARAAEDEALARHAAANAATSYQAALDGIKDAQAVQAKLPGAQALIKSWEDSKAALEIEEEAYRVNLEARNAEAATVAQARESHAAEVRKLRATWDDQAAAERRRLEDSRRVHDDQVRQLRAEYDAEFGRYQLTVNTLREGEVEARRNVQTIEAEIRHLKEHASTPCKNCGYVDGAVDLVALEAHLRMDRQIHAEAYKALAEVTSFPSFQEPAYTAQESALPPFVEPEFTPPPSTVPAFDESKLKGARADVNFQAMELPSARETVQAAAAAGARIEELTKASAEYRATAEREKARAEELARQVDPNLQGSLATESEKLTQLRARFDEAQRQAANATAKLDQARLRLEAYDRDAQQIEAAKTALATLQAEVAQWRLLELAFSDKGVQALELDALAPSIGAIANGLLRGAFGSRYQIEFRTTRLSGAGARQKQIEDFLIDVLDSETGETQELATLSGGEAVWIRRALYDAFGIIRARNTNLQFLTVFQDEADGALDPAAKLTYFRMLQAAHLQAGRRHTILISHDQGIQELVGTKIEVKSLAVAGKEAVAA